MSEILLAAEIPSLGLNRCMPEQELNLFKLTTRSWQSFAQVSRRSWRAMCSRPALWRAAKGREDARRILRLILSPVF
jgi:hypothetical protein